MNGKTSLNSRRYVTFFWITFFAVVTLNLVVWFYLVEQQFKQELRDKLLTISQLMTRLIDETEISVILPGEKNSIEYLYYQQLIEDIRANNDLQSVIIVSPQSEILVSSPEILSEQKVLGLYGNTKFQSALVGNPTVSEIENFADEKFMSSFAPIQNIDGFITAVIVIEAKAVYFDVFFNLRNRLLLFSAANFIIIILIGFFLLKMINKTIKYQSEIKEQEHLVQLGTMAATVAHELRNPLNIIEGTNDVIKKKYAKTPDEIFKYIPEEIKRLSILIENFLKFTRSFQLNIEKKSIKILVDRISQSLGTDQSGRLRISLQKDIEILTDHSLLELALLNIITNALQATDENGFVYIKFNQEKNTNLNIEVRDEGLGISQDTIDKIYEPFFTTKDKGTGLGLAITKRIVEHLKGTLIIKSEGGKGTIAHLDIPSLNKTIY